ncbi:MAG: tRNA pseudouridine(55) synthase TruB [Lachnospiraceae bacterium]|nr:tRNA pseudouridine(55) synthase TruB [Lachnospiraceae bacterium]
MNGILNVYKEKDYTSHDVVAKLRGILNTKKIGHTGTLDPMAEGVLPVCIGGATKLVESFADETKEYETVMLLGKTYDTLDVTGTLLEDHEVMSTKEEIESAVMSFAGGYDQVPPMYSAKKVGGQKLYDIARSGRTVERKSVFVNIFDIDILSIELPRVTMRVHCGKGTYIRSLTDDIGRKLGCGAAMEKLTRTRVGNFTIKEAMRLSEIEEAVSDNKITDVIISAEELFGDLVGVHTSGETSRLLANGNVISGASVRKLAPELETKVQNGTRVRMYDSKGKFTGVYEYRVSDDAFKPYKMFLNQE